MQENATPDQWAYYHAMRHQIAEAKRPRTASAMSTELSRLYPKALRAAKLRGMSHGEWHDEQLRLLVAFAGLDSIPIPEDPPMVAD